MPNGIKYSITGENNTLKKGNLLITTGSISGTTANTGFYNGVDVPTGGYVMYLSKASQGPSMYQISSDVEFFTIVKNISGNTYTTIAQCLSWAATQNDVMVVNKQYPNIVTNGLFFILDGDFIPSYPTTGTTWYDVSGNENNGTLVNGPTFNSNGWIDFDGVDDVVFLPTSNTLTGNNLQTLTMASMVKFTTSTTGYTFAIKRSGGDSTLITITINQNTSGTQNQSGFLGFLIRNQADTQHNYLTVNNGYNDGRWHQVVARVNGDTRTLFIDGQNLLENGGGMQSVAGNTALATLGSFGSSFYFNGSVSNAFFYRKSLTNSEILQNYYQAPIITDGLVFAVDAGNLVSYESGSTTTYSLIGSNSGSLVNGVGFSSGNGGSWEFDGVDDFINLSPSAINVNSVSFEVWCKVDNPSASGGSQIVWGYPNGTNQRIYLGFNGANGWDVGIQSTPWASTGILVDTNWHHFVVTMNNGSIKIYQEGIDVRTRSYTTFTTSGTDLHLGDNFSSSFSFSGEIANFKIYNRSLNPEEISQNFNAQRSRFGV